MFGTTKCVLFIEVSSLQGVLIREVPHLIPSCTTSVAGQAHLAKGTEPNIGGGGNIGKDHMWML